jgi:hypothetical protein
MLGHGGDLCIQDLETASVSVADGEEVIDIVRVKPVGIS